MSRPLQIALAAAVLAAVPSAVFAQELLFNPGFEDLDGVPGTDGQPTYGDGWGSFGAASFNNFFGSAESPNGHASLFTDMAGNFGGVFQQGIVGTPGTTYQFSLTDTFVEPRANADLKFGLEFYGGTDDGGTQLGVTLVPIDLSNPAVNHGGGQVFTMTAAAPAGTTFVRPIFRFDNASAPFTGIDGGPNIFVFAASLTGTPVPEPTALFGGGAAVVGLLARRRRTA